MAFYKVIATRVVHERVETTIEIDGCAGEAADYFSDNADHFDWEYNGQDSFDIVSVEQTSEEEVLAIEEA